MSRVPGLSERLVDDAAVFPPGNAPLTTALAAHAAWRGSRYEELVGPLLMPASAVDALRAAADPDGHLELGLVADTGLEGLIAARDAVQDDAWFTLVQLELPIPADEQAPEAVRRLLERLPFTAPTYLELPADVDPAPVLSVIADDGAERAKLRCGPTIVPSDAQLARFLCACARHRVPFKLTAGLHHALPATDEASGVRQHGFLNALVATWAAIDGADDHAVAALLSQTEAEPLLALLDTADTTRLRGLFRSFGSCSITEPYDELAALSLVIEEPA